MCKVRLGKEGEESYTKQKKAEDSSLTDFSNLSTMSKETSFEEHLPTPLQKQKTLQTLRILVLFTTPGDISGERA